MSLETWVSVTITKESAFISRVGFGVPLLLTYHTKFAEKAKLFTSPSSMLTANGGDFAATDLEYLLALQMFGQSLSPTQFVVGRRLTAPTRTVTLTPRSGTFRGETHPLATTDYSVTLSKDGVTETFTYTTGASPSVSDITDATLGLTNAINGGSLNVVASDNAGASITIEAADSPGGSATAGTVFTVEANRLLMTLDDGTADPGLVSDLNKVSTENDDWYAVSGDFWSHDEISALGADIEAKLKLLMAATQDDDVYTSSSADIASTLLAADYERTALTWHPAPHSGVVEGWMGGLLSKTPGSITWNDKSAGGSPVTNLTGAESAFLRAKRCNYYTSIGGNNVMKEGYTSSPAGFIDITRGIDWLQQRIKENVFARMAAVDKITYDQPGFDLIDNEIRGVLKTGVANGLLAADPAFTTKVPVAADADASDRASRLATGFEFTATLAGAVHKVNVAGKVII